MLKEQESGEGELAKSPSKTQGDQCTGVTAGSVLGRASRSLECAFQCQILPGKLPGLCRLPLSRLWAGG